MPAMKNLAGIRAAKQIALEAAKGTAIVSLLCCVAWIYVLLFYGGFVLCIRDLDLLWYGKLP